MRADAGQIDEAVDPAQEAHARYENL